MGPVGVAVAGDEVEVEDPATDELDELPVTELLTDELTLTVPVEDVEDFEELTLLLLVVATAVPFKAYTLRRFAPPQYSLAFPVHVIEQPLTLGVLDVWFTLPALMALPQ